MSSLGRRGLLIAFEGIDHSGKTTQSKWLAQSLKTANIPCIHISFPVRTSPTGKLLDQYLKGDSKTNDRAIHLLFSANRWEAADTISAALDSGKHVILDRYAYSGIAYSVAKGLSTVWCTSPDVGLPLPDVIIYLDLSVSTATARGGQRERYDEPEFQQRVKQVYETIRTSNWIIVDAEQSESHVRNAVECAIKPLL
jgi:dTMP kinase